MIYLQILPFSYDVIYNKINMEGIKNVGNRFLKFDFTVVFEHNYVFAQTEKEIQIF